MVISVLFRDAQSSQRADAHMVDPKIEIPQSEPAAMRDISMLRRRR
jgi:hypothetical protein